MDPDGKLWGFQKRVLLIHLSGLSLALVLMWGMMTGIGWTAEWATEPRLSVKGEFNDNLLLTSRPHDSVYGLWASPELNLRMSTERTNLIGNAHLDFVEYVDNKDLDMIQQFYNGTFQHRTERHEFGITGSYTRDSILLGELVETGVVGQLDVIGRRRFRKRQGVQPTWTYQLAERWSTSVNYNFSNVTYEVPPGSGFLDYQSHVGTATLSYKMFENATIYASGQTLYYHTTDAGNSSLSYGGELGGTYNWTERFKTSLFGGGRMVETTIDSGSTKETSNKAVGVYGATLEYQWEGYRARVVGSQSLNPSALGLLSRTDRVAVTLSGEVTEKLTADFTGEVLHNEIISGAQVSDPKTQYLSLYPSLQWRWHEQWGLRAGYQFRHLEQKSTGPTVTSESHAVTLILSYVFSPLTMSE